MKFSKTIYILTHFPEPCWMIWVPQTLKRIYPTINNNKVKLFKEPIIHEQRTHWKIQKAVGKWSNYAFVSVHQSCKIRAAKTWKRTSSSATNYGSSRGNCVHSGKTFSPGRSQERLQRHQLAEGVDGLLRWVAAMGWGSLFFSPILRASTKQRQTTGQGIAELLCHGRWFGLRNA